MSSNIKTSSQSKNFKELQLEAEQRWLRGDLHNAYYIYSQMLSIAENKEDKRVCNESMSIINYELNPFFPSKKETKIEKILNVIMGAGLILIFILNFSGTDPRDEFYTIGFQNENETHYFSSKLCKNYTQLIESNIHKSTHYINYSKTAYKLPKTQPLYEGI